MSRNIENKNKKKRDRWFHFFSSCLILAGTAIVFFICIGEIQDLSKRRGETDFVTGESLSEKNTDDLKQKMANDLALDSETTWTETEMESFSSENIENPEKTDEEKRMYIRENQELYPEKVLQMLDKNKETLDFVYHYLESQGKVSDYALRDDVKEAIGEGEIPLLIQWDERWGYGKYGSNLIATNGCGPACMAMVIDGLTDQKVTPYTMAKYSEANGYLTDDGNTTWSFISDGGKEFGVQGQAISLSEEIIADTLKKGFPIICSVRAGDFTDGGHFIVLTKYVDGKIKLNDPYSCANSEKLWEYDVLQPQIKNLWMMQVI